MLLIWRDAQSRLMIVLRAALLQFNDQSDQHFLLWHLSTFLLVPLPGKEKGFGWFLACCSPMAGIAIARTLTREKVGGGDQSRSPATYPISRPFYSTALRAQTCRTGASAAAAGPAPNFRWNPIRSSSCKCTEVIEEIF